MRERRRERERERESVCVCVCEGRGGGEACWNLGLDCFFVSLFMVLF